MSFKRIFISLLLLAEFSSVSHAQYQWHIVHPNAIDTFYYYFDRISCFGNNYVAAGAKFNYDPTPNQYLVAHSTDAGMTWNYVPLPRSLSVAPYYFYGAQQIDSLHGIVTGSPSIIFYSNDGWATAMHDSIFYDDAGSAGEHPSREYRFCSFANDTEGAVSGYSCGLEWTNKAGRTWSVFDSMIDKGYARVRSDGEGKFCAFVAQPDPLADLDMILTTTNYWQTIDTSRIQYVGPLHDSTWIYQYFFGKGDTIYSLGSPGSAIDTSDPTLSISPDLGQHWSLVLSVPNKIKYPTMAGYRTDTIVIWNTDTGGTMVMSTDHGNSWIVMNVSAPSISSGTSSYRITDISFGENGKIV
ncbi:MAG TPA: hypothetical protein VGM92_03310, partial [Candidatus Kapabacteria bacterium]